MSDILIGINGFGRIGRQICRQLLKPPTYLQTPQQKQIKVRAINSGGSPEELAYRFKYDTVHGTFEGSVTHTHDSIIIDNHKISVYNHKTPEDIPWGRQNISIVVECTGKFLTKDTAKSHLTKYRNEYHSQYHSMYYPPHYPPPKKGADYVIISAPAKDNETKMIVMGVNEETYKGEKIVSNASCTTNALAPIAKIIHDKYGIEEALMSTIHSVTASQISLDGSSKKKKDKRIGRAASGNIIPTTTGAAKAVGKVIPELENKITGMAFRVPTLNVSVVDLTVRVKTPTTLQELNEYITTQTKTKKLKNKLSCTNDPVVSSDLVGNKNSTIVDLSATLMLNDKFFKIVSWYDNEAGYSARIIDLIQYMVNHEFNKS